MEYLVAEENMAHSRCWTSRPAGHGLLSQPSLLAAADGVDAIESEMHAIDGQTVTDARDRELSPLRGGAPLHSDCVANNHLAAAFFCLLFSV